jgi:glycogen debranching enzyme
VNTPNETSPWQRTGEPASLGDPHGLVTLVEGQAFCLCSRTGDIGTGSPQGVFFADTRLVSSADLRIDGLPLEPLAVARIAGFAADFVARTRPAEGMPHPPLIVRRRRLGVVLREDIEVRNPRPDPVRCRVTLTVATDFADLFAVKESRAVARGAQAVEVHPTSLLFSWQYEGVRRRVEVSFSGSELSVTEVGATWHLTIAAHSTATVTWDVDTAFGARWFGSPPGSGLVDTSASRERSAAWLASTPQVKTDHAGLAAAFAQAIDDVGALRLFDPLGRRRPVIAAGAPWFMTLFGRDSLITSYMALPVDPSLALGVLEALAELQGQRVDPHTEEEPGRIMHETRFLDADDASFASGSVYYGTVDATPLFVVVLAELSRWGLPEPDLRALLPHADRALDWIEDFGDRDGDGYVEYLKHAPHGLDNQGWKDSWDGIRYHDGRVAQAPIALCEVQGYVYAAFVGRAEMAERLGDEATAARYRRKAVDLRHAFNHDFWIEERGWLAVGLGPDKDRIDSLASNMGHCLWSGILDEEHADAVRARLTGPSMWTGWGLRTLGADEPAFDPASYHCGSVWPHDNALAVVGFARYGFHDDAHRVMGGLLDAARHWDGRLPELFCGLDRADVATPVPFPTSCSPQAWAAASPLVFVRVLLGFAPDVPNGRCTIDPRLPDGITRLRVEDLRLWDTRVDVTVDESGVEVRLPAGLDVR